MSSNLIFLPMQYTGIAAYPRRVSEYPISFLHITKIECFGIKGLLIAGNLILTLPYQITSKDINVNFINNLLLYNKLLLIKLTFTYFWSILLTNNINIK
jgi:hypothetical protein